MRGLDRRTVLVTGAGRGIRRATAVRLVEEGTTVAVNDRTAERTADTVSTRPNDDASKHR
ncbi:SDR family NAD(P)-dependent oxidoreductase [Natrinema gelatinilyticum]|uniref:SDR family NAD(P)-dependent oxidoreductase n=1 Tax=Natrinema gelatinilyticum TaxID=2961571 RepID=UPI0020C25EC1|nr:SDR family NAD(P)-dependent oxidoreductase [Natrinema gelatinilyticum]